MKLLIAEDDLTSRTLLAAVSRKWGFEPIAVEDGESAWQVMREPQPPCLLLLDWMMPRLDGLGLCRRIRQSQSQSINPPFIILLTARSETGDIVAGLEAGANDYIAKPFANAELQARLEVGKRMLALQTALHQEIAERQKLQGQLEKQSQQLEQRVLDRTREVSRLLEQKNNFIARLGHDLKTPLTPMKALLPMLLQRSEDKQDRKMLGMAIAQTDFIQNLVEKTLLLAQLNSPNTRASVEDVNLCATADKVVNHLSHIFDEHNAKVTNNISAAISLAANPLELEQLLQNLLTNAVKYSGEQVVITLDAQIHDDNVTVSVADQGIGMNPDQLAKMFEEFWKACEARNDLASHGLGLNICQSIVDRHRGRIWAQSPGPGQGTTMYFSLPRARAMSEPAAISDGVFAHDQAPDQLRAAEGG